MTRICQVSWARMDDVRAQHEAPVWAVIGGQPLAHGRGHQGM